MLPYLVNPAQPTIRKWNFTQIGINLQANGSLNGPCRIAVHLHADPGEQERVRGQRRHLVGHGRRRIPLTAGIPAEGFEYCCEVNVWQKNHGKDTYTIRPLDSKSASATTTTRSSRTTR